jgi:hypothetical protein
MGTQGLVEKLSLKGMADEDIYFAKRDRELIEALHCRKLGQQAGCDSPEKEKKARAYEQRFHDITRKHEGRPKRLLKAYRKLLKKIKEKCHHH